MSLQTLFTDIEAAIAAIGHGWTTPAKGQIMASMIVALRPACSVEIGVYAGKGLISLALAHRAINFGKAIGVDPYDPKAALEGQQNPADRKFWADCDYNAMLRLCQSSLAAFGCAEYANLIVQKSSEAKIPPQIGLLRIDGNHGEIAIADTFRWAPFVQRGGFLFIDDLQWTGQAPSRAAKWIEAQEGWKLLYALDDGVVFQRL